MSIIDIYLTDLIDIIDAGLDKNGVPNTATQSSIKARVESKNQLILDKDGKEVVGNTFLIVENSASLSYTKLIKFKKIDGEDTEQPDKLFPIKSYKKAHGFDKSHWEVWL